MMPPPTPERTNQPTERTETAQGGGAVGSVDGLADGQNGVAAGFCFALAVVGGVLGLVFLGTSLNECAGDVKVNGCGNTGALNVSTLLLGIQLTASAACHFMAGRAAASRRASAPSWVKASWFVLAAGILMPLTPLFFVALLSPIAEIPALFVVRRAQPVKPRMVSA